MMPYHQNPRRTVFSRNTLHDTPCLFSKITYAVYGLSRDVIEEGAGVWFGFPDLPKNDLF